MVTSGRARGAVVATGPRTAMGRIRGAMQQVGGMTMGAGCGGKGGQGASSANARPSTNNADSRPKKQTTRGSKHNSNNTLTTNN